MNIEYELIDCESNWLIIGLSYLISYCYICGPFIQGCYLILVIRLISKVNENGGLDLSQDEEEEQDTFGNEDDDNGSFKLGS